MIGHALYRLDEQGQISSGNPARRMSGRCFCLGGRHYSRRGPTRLARDVSLPVGGVGLVERRPFLERQVVATIPAAGFRFKTQVMALRTPHRGPCLSSRGARAWLAVA